MNTLEVLRNRIQEIESYPYQEVTTEKVGRWLCGENHHLAKDPTSKKFIENVMYNSTNSFYGVLFLQLQQHSL